LGEAEQPDGQRGVGLDVDEVGNGDDTDLAANRVDRLTTEQETQVARLPQGCDIEGNAFDDPRQAPGPARSQPATSSPACAAGCGSCAPREPSSPRSSSGPGRELPGWLCASHLFSSGGF